MKVALACPYAWDDPGGVQTHIRQLARQLRLRGHRTLTLTPSWKGSAEPGVAVVGRPLRVPYNGSFPPVCPDPRSARRIGTTLREFRPDVVHAHEPFAPSTAMYSALVSPVPVVATFHAYADTSLVLEAFAPVLSPLWRRLSVRLAVSQAAASFVGRNFRGRLDVVPNGVDVDLFRGADPADLPPGRRLLFVNRLEPRKGFAVAARAFSLVASDFPDAFMVVAGDGPEAGLVADLPREVRSRILMLGTVSHGDLPAYYSASDVFLAPARGRESFGIVLVEAMAAGLAVVATDIAGYREVVRHDVEGLLVPPSSPELLAEAIKRLLSEPGLRAKLGSAGRRRAQLYRWEAVVQRLEAAYWEAARSPS